MSYVEHPIIFSCCDEKLLGILTKSEATGNVGVVIPVGGPQYRAGSHRQFVLLARFLAEAGFTVLRFDYRGMGDSTGDLRQFEEVSDDISAAIDAFQHECPEVERVVLWGLCDAASSSLIYWDATKDRRLAGLILLNPWVRSEASLATTHLKHYYGQRLFQADFWIKLLSFRLGIFKSVKGVMGAWRRARANSLINTSAGSPEKFQSKMVRALHSFPGQTLLILSGDDYTAKEFLEYFQADSLAMQALSTERLERIDLADADHTFSSPKQQRLVESTTIAWLEKQWATGGADINER